MSEQQSAFVIEPDLRELRPITRRYSPEEKQEMANQASDLNNSINDLNAQKKEAVAEFTKKIKDLKVEQDILTQRRTRGFDQETIMCEGHLEEKGGTWFMVFYDSAGIEVDSRHATPSERQTRLKAANE